MRQLRVGESVKIEYKRVRQLHGNAAASTEELNKAQLAVTGASVYVNFLNRVQKAHSEVEQLQKAAIIAGPSDGEAQRRLAHRRADLQAAVRDAEGMGIAIPRAVAGSGRGQLASLLGKSDRSAEVQAFRATLPVPEISTYPDASYWKWKTKGLEIRLNARGEIMTLFFGKTFAHRLTNRS